jgi:hypothetical protein
MHGPFRASCNRLAELVARHEQAFVMDLAGGVELALLGVGRVVAKAIS